MSFPLEERGSEGKKHIKTESQISLHIGEKKYSAVYRSLEPYQTEDGYRLLQPYQTEDGSESFSMFDDGIQKLLRLMMGTSAVHERRFVTMEI